MSVLIKGMQMPEDCFSCPLKEEGFCNITNAYAGNIYEKNSDCPLVKLPEHHGRLFDVDEVEKCLEEIKDYDDKASAIALLEWAIGKRWCIEAEDEG